MDVSYIFKYANIRITQLKREEKIDIKLKDYCYTKCPDILSEYLLTHRLINRNYADKFQNSSFFNYPNLISENLTYCDSHLHDMEKVITTCLPCRCNPCDRLKEVIERMKKLKI